LKHNNVEITKIELTQKIKEYRKQGYIIGLAFYSPSCAYICGLEMMDCYHPNVKAGLTITDIEPHQQKMIISFADCKYDTSDDGIFGVSKIHPVVRKYEAFFVDREHSREYLGHL
jgi:hypothetical protein